jgi:hypothetical protein
MLMDQQILYHSTHVLYFHFEVDFELGFDAVIHQD